MTITRAIRRGAALATAAALFTAACGDPTAPRTDLLVVTADGRAVTLTNRTSEPVSFLVATPGYLELADPLPCTRPEGCTPTLAAGGVQRVPYAEIPGYAPGARTAVVLHWRRLAAAVTADSVRRLAVRLR